MINNAKNPELYYLGFFVSWNLKILLLCVSDESSDFDWDTYLKQTRSIAAPENLFPEVPNYEKMLEDFPVIFVYNH